MVSTPTERDTRRALALAVVASVSCGEGAAPETCAGLGDDVPIARSLPAHAEPVRVRELWRIGGDGDAYVGFPLPLAVSPQGRTAIADFSCASTPTSRTPATSRSSRAP